MKKILLMIFLSFQIFAAPNGNENRLREKINNFITHVKNGDFARAKALGSWRFAYLTKDEDLEYLKKMFEREEKPEFESSGTYRHPSGNTSVFGILKLGNNKLKYLQVSFTDYYEQIDAMRAE